MSEQYPIGDHQYSNNLGLALWGTDEVTTENFLLIDAAFGAISTAIFVNSVAVPNPNFINSASVTFSVAGSNISATSMTSGGTVTSFSAGALSPLFTTSVATPTTTPALSFSLSNAAQNSVFAGPSSGGAGAPSYRALVAADIPNSTITPAWANLTGDLTETQVIPWDGGTVGTPDTGISRLGVATIGIGNGTQGNFSGNLKLTGLNIVGALTDGTASVGTSGQVLSSTVTGVKWITVASGSGTVTSFSAGTLSPLFTTSVATPTTTPALTFALTNAAGGTVFGNPTGTTGAPSYTAAPVLGVNASVAGTLGLATATASGATITLQNTAALTAYNFNLPTTVGAAGSVLTSQGGGSTAMTWTTQAALGVSWSSLTNASANLTLNNVAFTTTFQQQTATTVAGTIWLWANTTAATVSTQLNSPQLELAANYYTGSASAQDTWSIGSSVAAGTNGISTLSFVHSGSTGLAQVQVPGLVVGSGTGVIGAQATPAIVFGSSTFGFWFNGSAGTWSSASANYTTLIQGTVRLPSGGRFAWSSSSTDSTAASDTGMSRLAAGSLAIGNGTAGNTTGNLSLGRVNLSSTDMSGTATITAGNTTKAVSFVANYTTTAAPIVVLTPTSDPLALGVPVGYWVTYSGATGAWTGFTVNIQTTLAGNVTFNYIVIGQA